LPAYTKGSLSVQYVCLSYSIRWQISTSIIRRHTVPIQTAGLPPPLPILLATVAGSIQTGERKNVPYSQPRYVRVIAKGEIQLSGDTVDM